ncbi:hypothetical protein ISN76_03165 [Dyella halodurans]
MGVGKFLIGCALCVGGIGAASAMDADTQDLTSMQRSVDSSSSTHDGGGNSSGDALGLPRDASPSSGSASSSSSNDNCPSTTPPAAPSGHRAYLGWQSLLPGSIQ